MLTHNKAVSPFSTDPTSTTMKFTCTQENLSHGLSIVGHLANKSVTLPILSHVLVKIEGKAIKLQTTNLELAVSSVVRGKVDAEGEFTVPAKLFSDFVTLLPNDHVECAVSEGQLTIASKNVRTQLRGIASSEFPLIPAVNKVIGFTVPARALREALQQVVFAASASETRPEISGVLFNWNGAGTLTLAATDSYRLSERQVPAQGEGGKQHEVIVPARTAHELLRVLGLAPSADEPVEVAVGENQIGFTVGAAGLTSRLIEGRYPDYRQIIPESAATSVLVERGALTRAVRSAGLFTRTGLYDVQLRINSGNKGITVVGRDAQTGEQTVEVPCTVTGSDATVTLNHRYLLDGLGAIVSDRVSLQLVDGSSPVVMRPDDNAAGLLYIVMPIKQ